MRSSITHVIGERERFIHFRRTYTGKRLNVLPGEMPGEED